MSNHTTNDTPIHLCECGCGRPTPIARQSRTDRGQIRGQPIRFLQGHGGHDVHRIPAEKRFHERVDKSGDCWIWLGRLTDDGYGILDVDVKGKLAHRLAWEMESDSIPDGMEVCHHCDNPRCVRVSHLFLGTHQENIADRDRKERGGVAKLTKSQVAEIRRIYSHGSITQKELAARYGVARCTISAITTGTNWKHIP